MPFTKEAKKYAKVVSKVYKIIYDLQGTEDLAAYNDLFSDIPRDARLDYEILGNRTNRRLMVALYQGRNPTVEGLAATTRLSIDEVIRRIEFFRANGMKRINIRKAA